MSIFDLVKKICFQKQNLVKRFSLPLRRWAVIYFEMSLLFIISRVTSICNHQLLRDNHPVLESFAPTPVYLDFWKWGYGHSKQVLTQQEGTSMGLTHWGSPGQSECVSVRENRAPRCCSVGPSASRVWADPTHAWIRFTVIRGHPVQLRAHAHLSVGVPPCHTLTRNEGVPEFRQQRPICKL